ncbi:MAG TPA: hypothetical protein VMH83_06740 [Candidatus Acidoferrum sp.]|nr:hypothetical protein [Candidatus Acidoferrum sp.]
MTPIRSLSVSALALVAGLTGSVARAELDDEIQVYADEINDPGQFGVELHAITFPSARSVPDYAGEVTPNHALYLTTELSWGLSKTFEAGMYIPFARDSDGGFYSGGVKGRLKWLPVKEDEAVGGWYAGANVEYGYEPRRFSDVAYHAELRTMFGWRDHDWLLGINPTFGWDLSNGASGQGDFNFGFKGTRRVAEGLAMGIEYYADTGPLANMLPRQQQDQKLFFVIDVDRAPWVFNFGIGTGLTAATADTTIKFIFELPI